MKVYMYLVGIEEHSSAIPSATHCIKHMAIIQPHTIPGVPAYPIPEYPFALFFRTYTEKDDECPDNNQGRNDIPYQSVLANEGSKPSTEKLTQKVVHNENSLLNSCL